jgi:serine/threonine protein kinase
MRSEQYQNVGQLYHAALDLPRENRSAFLDGACEGDQELRHDVHSLLEAHDDAGAFIERPALEVAAQWIARQEEAETLSGRIGAYEVRSLIGRGGMGEVYLAHNTRLGRQEGNCANRVFRDGTFLSNPYMQRRRVEAPYSATRCVRQYLDFWVAKTSE